MTKEKMQIIEEMIKGKALCVMATSDGQYSSYILNELFCRSCGHEILFPFTQNIEKE